MAKTLSAIPGITTNFSQVIQDNVEESLSGFRGEIVAKISGDNLDILEEKADDVVEVIQNIRGATDVEATRIGGQSEIVVTPDRSRLARYGIGISDVNRLVTQAMSGASVTSFYEGEKLVRKEVDLEFDAAPDLFKFYEDGQLARLERDSDDDKKIDYWEFYVGGKLEKTGVDVDKDGQPDPDKWKVVGGAKPAPAEEAPAAGSAPPPEGEGAAPAPASAPESAAPAAPAAPATEGK
jgi:hypothetical protein